MVIGSRSRAELTTEGALRAPRCHCTSRAAEQAATAATSATIRIRSATEDSSGSPEYSPGGDEVESGNGDGMAVQCDTGRTPL